jgi:translation elongation factor EF-Tu-like GTPase
MIRSPEELGYVEADLTTIRAEDGGRKSPIQTGYRPNWWLPAEAGNVWTGGTVEIVDAEALAPGATGTIRIYPFVPDAWERVQIGSHIEMCEGRFLVGKGTVTRVVPAAIPAGAH